MKHQLGVALLAVALIGGLHPILLQAQDPVREEKEGMYDSCRNLNGPRPNLNLPEGIPAKSGELNCHADFDNVKDGWIRIFLVNRTGTPAKIVLVHGSPEFKAYRDLGDGNWERVQPNGSFVMCADSIGELSIHPGMFVSFEAAYHPEGEHPGTIRYQFPGHSSWISNTGPGFWDSSERDLAQADGQISWELPPWSLTADRDYDEPAQPGTPERPQIGKSLARIELLLNFRESRAAKLWCEQLLAKSENFPSEWREAARERIVALKDRMPDAAKNAAEFAGRCLDLLTEGADQTEFGSPAAHPEIVWTALGWLGREADTPDSLPWERIFILLEKRFCEAKAPELEGMCLILDNERFVNEFIRDDFLWDGMKSDQRTFQARCVKLLLQRGLVVSVTKTARELDENGKFAVAAVLANRETLAQRYGPINDFLIECAKENPGKAIDAIYEGCGKKTDIYLEPGLWLALEPYMVKTVSRGLDGPAMINDYYERDRMVRILQIGMRDRSKFLRKILASEAYYEQKSETSEGMKIEKVRFMSAAAKRALLEMREVP